MVFDFEKLTRSEWIAGGGGVALLVVMLVFKWYGVKETGLLTFGGPGGTQEGLTRNAFESFTFVDLVLLLTALSAIALALLGASERVPSLPVPLGLLVGALGAISLMLIVIRIISPPDLAMTVGGEHVRVSDVANSSVTRKIGVWLGSIATGLVAYGGFGQAVRYRLE